MQRNVIQQNNGQTMILSTVLIGGALLAATAIAGFMLFFQIRQAGDAAQSAASFYAADSGIEATLYCYYHEFNSGTEKIETGCEKGGSIMRLGKNEGSCGSECKSIATYNSKPTCFSDPSDKTVPIDCQPGVGSPDVVKGIYVLSKGTTAKTERVLDYTIVTGSGL